jgi:outer membrane protein OmpA-like peptidoglycan-associated protein
MNLELSKKRAEAVKNTLAKDFGIDPGRMETDGKGEQEPLAPNTDAIAKANNRRVEFVKMN